MSTKKTVELFYDVLSPYSWTAFEVLMRCRPVWNVNVDLQPVLLAGIMKATDNSPPGLNPVKGMYLVKDVERTFKFYKLGPVKFPEDPVNVLMVKGSLPAMRLLTAAKISHPNQLENLSREFWTRVYRTDEDLVSPESLSEVCTKVGLGVAETEKLIEQSNTQSVKKQLQETTQIAVDHGAFGAPILLVEDQEGKKEMFFGSDRFHFIAQCLGVQWPLDN